MNSAQFKKIFFHSAIFIFWIGVLSAILMIFRIDFDLHPRSITIFSWHGTFEREYVKKFEEATGIKVYMSYYATNEELLVKLQSSQAGEYDLIVPSDYMVKKLIDQNLLQKIDKSKLSFISELNPLLLGHFFDPTNEYSIPFEWEVYIIGINTNLLNPEQIAFDRAWDLIFKPASLGNKNRIVMVNDPVETVLFSANYLFGKVNTLDLEQIEQVKQLLIKQKPWVEAYADIRADYLLGTDNAAVSIGQSSEIWRAQRDYKNIGFIIPAKTYISIENCAIFAGSKKEDLVYQFLNFFFSRDLYQSYFNQQLFCPARLDVVDGLDVSERHKEIMRSSPKAFNNYSFIRDLVSERQKNEIWIAVRSS